jgi:hypothetical protein
MATNSDWANFDYETWRLELLKRLASTEQAFYNPGQLQDIEHDDESHKRACLMLALGQISGLKAAVLQLPGFDCALPLKPANELMGQLIDFANGKRADFFALPITKPRADPITMVPTKGFASFAVNVLLQKGRTENKASIEVAKIMSHAGFKNRSGGTLTKHTVSKWCKAAMENDDVKYFEQGLWGKFLAHFGNNWVSLVVSGDVLEWLEKAAENCLQNPLDE